MLSYFIYFSRKIQENNTAKFEFIFQLPMLLSIWNQGQFRVRLIHTPSHQNRKKLLLFRLTTENPIINDMSRKLLSFITKIFSYFSTLSLNIWISLKHNIQVIQSASLLIIFFDKFEMEIFICLFDFVIIFLKRFNNGDGRFCWRFGKFWFFGLKVWVLSWLEPNWK